MSAQSQRIESSSPIDLPLKRKRGRPRKDDLLIQEENMVAMPESECTKNSKQMVSATSAIDDDMVGQVVSGVIEGSFDAGYLLNVKVGDTDTHLRGVAFLPGRFYPVSATNDVAPEAKMYHRKEMPIPVLNLPIQLPDSVPLSEQSSKQADELKNPASLVQDSEKLFEIQPSVPAAQQNQSASTMLPLTYNLPTSSPGPTLGGKVMPPQILELGIESQPISMTALMGHDKVVKQDEVLKDLEVSRESGNDIKVERTEKSKLVQQSEPSEDISPVTETVGLVLQFQHQSENNDLKPNKWVHGVKNLNIEHKGTPSNAEPKIISSEPIKVNMWMGKQASPEKVAPSGNVEKNSNGGEKLLLGGSPANHAANVTSAGFPCAPVASLPSMLFERETILSPTKVAAEGHSLRNMIEAESFGSGAINFVNAGSDSTPITNLPVTLFERETISSESKIIVDGPGLPRKIETQLCSSSGSAGNVGYSITDTIPPTGS